MGEKDRRRARLATMPAEEREKLRDQRLAEKAAESAIATLEAEDSEAIVETEDEQEQDEAIRDGGSEFQVRQLHTLDKAERAQLKADIAAEPEPMLSTMQVARRLSRFAKPHWRAISFGLLLLALQSLMDLARPWPLAYSVDAVVKKDSIEGATLNTLIIAAGMVIAIAVFQGFFSYLETLVVSRAGRTMTRDMRAALFEHVQKLSLQFHSRRRSGDLLLRVSGDVNALQQAFTGSLIEIINSIFFLTGIVGVMIYMDWQIGLISLAGTPFMFFYVKRYSSDIRTFTAAQRRREGALASLFNEALASTRLSRVFNREEAVRDRFASESAASLELGMEASLKEERFTWGVEILGAILTSIVMIFAVYRAQSGAISLGELFLFFFYIRQVYRPIRSGLKEASRVWRSLAQAERVIELLDMEYGVTDSPNAKQAPLLRGEIEFRNVSFNYDTERTLMQGVSVKIPAKRITAVVGPTGAGKTTLVSMVPRLYDPDSGDVFIDGHNLREWTLGSLRDQISVVLQESTLLYATVAENIAYGRPDADMAQIEAAAWLAGAHDFIKDLPNGYQTEVGERGDTLSGGQRQLIAIARAIIRDAPIVILDEPMTGLDATSSSMVRDGLERLMTDKTVLFITHNLALVENADNVIVMRDGAVVQQGRPHELRDADGLFKSLFDAQFEDESVIAGMR